jgi:hypothetical protein
VPAIHAVAAKSQSTDNDARNNGGDPPPHPTRSIAKELRGLSIQVSPNTVARLLSKMKFSLRTNRKKSNPASQSNPVIGSAETNSFWLCGDGHTISIPIRQRGRERECAIGRDGQGCGGVELQPDGAMKS